MALVLAALGACIHGPELYDSRGYPVYGSLRYREPARVYQLPVYEGADPNSGRRWYVGRVFVREAAEDEESRAAADTLAREIRTRWLSELRAAGVPAGLGGELLNVGRHRERDVADELWMARGAWREHRRVPATPPVPLPELAGLPLGPAMGSSAAAEAGSDGRVPVGLRVEWWTYVGFSAWVVLPDCTRLGDRGLLATYWLPRSAREAASNGPVLAHVVASPMAPALRDTICAGVDSDAATAAVAQALTVLALADEVTAESVLLTRPDAPALDYSPAVLPPRVAKKPRPVLDGATRREDPAPIRPGRHWYVGRFFVRRPLSGVDWTARWKGWPIALRYLLAQELAHRGVRVEWGRGMRSIEPAGADRNNVWHRYPGPFWLEDNGAPMPPSPPAPWLDVLGWGQPDPRTPKVEPLTAEGLTRVGVRRGLGMFIGISAWVVIPDCEDAADPGQIATLWLPPALREEGKRGKLATRVVTSPMSDALRQEICARDRDDGELLTLAKEIADLALADTLGPGVRAFPPLPAEATP